MRLIPRHRNHDRRFARIAISQEEIAADLHYPASRRREGRAPASGATAWGTRR